MINGLRLELEDVGPIADAKLDINRINIIGGQNSTGKSTASKLLYCFLKANSSSREKLVAPVLYEKLDNFYLSLRYLNDGHNKTFQDLVQKTGRMKDFIKNRRYNSFSDILFWFEEIEILFNKTMHFGRLSSDPSGQILDEEEPRLIEDFKRFYDQNQRKYSQEQILHAQNYEKLIDDFDKVKRIIDSVEGGGTDFFREVMTDLLYSELDMDFMADFYYAKLYDSLNSNFLFEVKFDEYDFVSEGKFNISNVFYLESFSIFDNYLSNDYDSEHVIDLKEHLFPKTRPSRMYEDESIKKLEEIVTNVLGGRIIKKDGNLKFVSKDSVYTCPMKNTASGIKQIAVIQTLLRNHFLSENCVLIMDEPEVNLHPEWQIKLARILVLLAKEGDITIYINSHSPMFIEAIDTFSEYYDFEEYVSYYLSEKNEDIENRFDFNPIPSDELYLIYDNLGDPYDYLDRVRLSKGRKEVDDDFNF